MLSNFFGLWVEVNCPYSTFSHSALVIIDLNLAKLKAFSKVAT